MSQYYFSVDVETTSTNPFFGELLSVGLVAIEAESLKNIEEMYVPFKYSGALTDPQTYDWWHNRELVSQAAYDAAWEYDHERFSEDDGARMISEFVNSFGESLKDRIFAANPVSFDYPWIQKLYFNTNTYNPFHYRTLCMRSLYFGISGDTVYGESRASSGEFHVPKLAHHALEDARAQALDLILMLTKARAIHKAAGTQERKLAILNG